MLYDRRRLQPQVLSIPKHLAPGPPALALVRRRKPKFSIMKEYTFKAYQKSLHNVRYVRELCYIGLFAGGSTLLSAAACGCIAP